MGNELDVLQGLEMWDEVPEPGQSIPFEDHDVVIKDSGIQSYESGGHSLYWELYFPKYNQTRTMSIKVDNTRQSIGLIKSALAGLGFKDVKDRLSIMTHCKESIGWTVKVKVYQSKSVDKNGNPYVNYRFLEVLDRTSASNDIPF